MSRPLTLLCVTCAVGLGSTTWVMLGAGATERIEVPARGLAQASGAPPAATDRTAEPPLASELRQARASCQLAAVDSVVEKLRAAVREAPADRSAWHLLAEAHLERALVRAHERGMAVGAPTYAQLPRDVAADLDAGQAAANRARELGDDSGELFRIEAGLMSQRITGLATALQWNGKIQQALARASERARDNPHLHTALGLRKLLAPKLLGHDPAQALEHFEFAAAAPAADERPEVFAAMASYLQRKRQQAIGWLERAVARNPHNRFARVVLARLRAGEDDPFGRDVTAAEAAATK